MARIAYHQQGIACATNTGCLSRFWYLPEVAAIRVPGNRPATQVSCYRPTSFLAVLMTMMIMAIGLISAPVTAQTMRLSTTNNDYTINNVFSDVDVFAFDIEIDAPLAVGVYTNPDIIQVTYRVMGSLVAGTPSGFPAFDLQRTISGEEFYAQGSSLQFEIATTAVLDDGVQVGELVGNGAVLTFDGREVGNGRFHPALFVLNADGSGSIRNSDNVPSTDPLVTVVPGAEYITELLFDAGNTTVLTAVEPTRRRSSGGGVMPVWLILLFGIGVVVVKVTRFRGVNSGF